jgi:transposase
MPFCFESTTCRKQNSASRGKISTKLPYHERLGFYCAQRFVQVAISETKYSAKIFATPWAWLDTASMQSNRKRAFSWQDRQRLRRAVVEAATARLLRRVQAVLRVAEGYPLAEAARLSGVDRTSVHRWVGAYLHRHVVADLQDRPHTGRPRETDDLDAELLEAVLSQDPRTVGYQATTWTAPLLATHLREEYGCVISERTLRRRLREYDWRWKRPRYLYRERAEHVAQKKGRLFAA